MNNFEKAKAEFEKKQATDQVNMAMNSEATVQLREAAKDVMKQMEQPDLTPREAIVAFVAWLTTRPNPVCFSAAHDSAKACNLANQFCDWNNWPKCREDYTERYKVPGEE